MLKLVGGHVHTHSPTGLATKTPSRDMEQFSRSFDDAAASPTADQQQESGSHTFSEGTPPVEWSDGAMQAEKRRKMNRESARRTRLRKQQEMVSLKAEVAALQNQSLCSSERLKAMSEKNQELSAETQKTYEDNHLLNKCVGELSVVCKRKQATLEQLSRYIQTADKLSDIPLPPIEQVEDQLSPESLQLLRRPLSSPKPAAGRSGLDPVTTLPAAATSHLPTPLQMHDIASAYMPTSEQTLRTPLQQDAAFSCKPMMQSSSARSSGMMSLSRSSSMDTLPWIPTGGSARRPQATSFPCNRAPHNLALQQPLSTSANPAGANQSGAQQAEGAHSGLHHSSGGHASAGLGGCYLPGISYQPQPQSSSARQALLFEAAKQQNGFNPKRVSDIVRMTQQLPVQRASSDPSFFRLTPAPNAYPEAMQEILERSIDWKSEDFQQPPQRSLGIQLAHCHTTQQAPPAHDLQIPALDCSQQVLDTTPTGFQMPMQRLNDHMSSPHNYGMH